MELRFKKCGKTLLVSLDGELDHHNAASVREDIDRKFTDAKTKNIVFNLQKLEFMDSSGLGIFIGRYKAVSAIGGKTFIAAPTPTAKRLIVLSGIHKIIPIYKSIDEALGGVV